MIVCDRCHQRVDDKTRAGSYRAVLSAPNGLPEVVAEFADLCSNCLQDLKRRHFRGYSSSREAHAIRSGLRTRTRTSRGEGAKLKGEIVQVLRGLGGQGRNDEILRELQGRGSSVPGAAPEQNLRSYLSRLKRDGVLLNVAPGLWRLCSSSGAETGRAENGGASLKGGVNG